MKKKLLLFQHWSTVGGSGISLYNTWLALREDYDIDVFLPAYPNDLPKYLRDRGVAVFTYSFVCGQISYYSGGSTFYKPGFILNIFRIIRTLYFLKGIIKKQDYDVWAVNSMTMAWMSLLLSSRRSVCFVRETLKGGRYNLINILLRYLLNKFSLVIFLTKYDMYSFKLATKSAVIPDFICDNPMSDLQSANKSKGTSAPLQLLFVGGYDPIKGLKILLESMTYVDFALDLYITADDPVYLSGSFNCTFFRILECFRKTYYLKQILSLLSMLPSTVKCNFVKHQSDLSNYYRTCDCLVFPMKNAHQPRPVFEVGLFSKPAIITGFPNISDYYIDNYNCLYFLKNDPFDLYRKIRLIRHDQTLRRYLGANNKVMTDMHHTLQAVKPKLLDLFESL